MEVRSHEAVRAWRMDRGLQNSIVKALFMAPL